MSEPLDTPLSGPNPDSLTILFAPTTDPLTLTDAQISLAILELRRRRNVVASEEAAKALAPKKTRTKAPVLTSEALAKTSVPASELSLDDLEG